MIGHGAPMGVSFQGNFDLKINPSMSRHDKNNSGVAILLLLTGSWFDLMCYENCLALHYYSVPSILST